MMTTCKPYRLINETELQQFRQRFSAILATWNQAYSTQFIDYHLARPDPNKITGDFRFLLNDNKPLALLSSNYLSFLKNSLFKDDSSCFDLTVEAFLLDLVKQLLAVESLELSPHFMIDTDEWFYYGAPSLMLTLQNEKDVMQLYPHPQWVLSQLPIYEPLAKPLNKLADALATQLLELTVELESLRLPINKLHNLKIGDVIQTDHPLSAPLSLQYQQQMICKVKVGQFQHHKSIQLTR